MLSGQGWTAIAGCRQFFYARYADWMITTTLIVILLGQVANAGNDVIFGACGANGEASCEHFFVFGLREVEHAVDVYLYVASRLMQALAGCPPSTLVKKNNAR